MKLQARFARNYNYDKCQVQQAGKNSEMGETEAVVTLSILVTSGHLFIIAGCLRPKGKAPCNQATSLLQPTVGFRVVTGFTEL